MRRDYEMLGEDGAEVTFFQRYRLPLAIGAVVLALVIIGAIIGIIVGVVVSQEDDDDDSINLANRMKIANVMQHLQSFQKIADENNGTRASVTPGFNASVDYIVNTLKAAGYKPIVQYFPLTTTRTLAPPTFQQVDPKSLSYQYLRDFRLLQGSGSGTVENQTLSVVANYGCDAADFATVTPGSVALILRSPPEGGCGFGDKVTLAEAANAGAVVVYNDAAAPDRADVFSGSLGMVSTIPALSASFFVGENLKCVGSATISISAHQETAVVITANVIADTSSGREDSIIQLGGHLDSVEAGPGINDDGSGSALVLELALQAAKSGWDHHSKVRFSWWGAEELGLLGSTYFVDNFKNGSTPEFGTFGDTVAYLNFDMVGSPNFMRSILNGTTAVGAGQVGSEKIQNEFKQYFEDVNLTYILSSFGPPYRSDYGPFISSGIPSGGLFTGAEGTKSAPERTLFGGLTNTAYDPCYHQPCDTIENIHQGVLEENCKAAAFMVQKLAELSDPRAWLDNASATEEFII